MDFPRLLRIRQRVADDALEDCRVVVRAELDRARAAEILGPGKKVVIAVGSRGIDRYTEIVREVAEYVIQSGAQPLIVPAMGSHAGGTAESQSRILLDQGIGGPGFPAAVRSSVRCVPIGKSALGEVICLDTFAAGADAIFVVNRIKAHTDFDAPVESGIAKMLLVGLGKPEGAARAHRSFRKYGFYPALADGVQLILKRVPAVLGIALVENEHHRCMKIQAIPGEELLTWEAELLLLSKSRMASLPMERLDLLVVEEIGKDISGSGMDTNVISRKGDRWSGMKQNPPQIGYIYVRTLSPASHGNGVGIGLADFCSNRVVRSIDYKVTYLNCLTSGTPAGAALPVHLDSDLQTLEAAVGALPLESPNTLQMAWIKNTLSLEEFYVSEAVLHDPNLADRVEAVSAPMPMTFDADGNLKNPFKARQTR